MRWFLVSAVFVLPVCAADLEAEARDVLARRCLNCHSARVKSGGLDLSSRESAVRGGTQGPALRPGASSLLLTRVTRKQMPPGAPLPPAETGTLERWIAAGAPWTTALSERRAGLDWWSLQPLATQPGRNSIDHWIQAKLQERGLQPAPPADRATLIRRVTFGLTGLPPTPEDIAAFVADTRPDAYGRLVDGLLASPRYGEHWARHWLDVARYAESEGFERDWLRENVWPYRDYVIRSFNADKPYAQFVREQIAGDVLPGATRDSLIATTFLTMGPIDAVGLTSAVEQERTQVREDQLEEMVGVVAQTFLGLTVNCARCHDHKFDPIPQRDYYRLKAVFESVWQPTEGDELKADGCLLLTPEERTRREETIRAIRTRIVAAEESLAAIDRAARPQYAGLKPLARWSLDTDARDDLGFLHAELPASGRFAEGRLQGDSVTLVTAPLTHDLREKTLEAWIHVAKPPEKNTTVFRIRNRSGFRGAAYDGIQFIAGKTRQWENMSTVRFRSEEVSGPAEDTPAGGRIQMAITYAADGEIRLYRNGQPYGKAYRPDQGLPQGRLQTYLKADALVELTSANGLELEEARLYDAALSPAQIASSYEQGVKNFGPSGHPDRTRLVNQVAEARRELASLAKPEKVFAARTVPAGPTHLLLRGDVNRKGEIVAPGAISGLRGLSGDLGLSPDAPDAEKRLRLADWITSPANPLFARVIVNRVWHHHFGAGLVENPNDLGYNGGLPSHPELLDWLALEFQQSGGSLKQLHKLILTSDTYRQSSQWNQGAATIDSDNRLLWRYPHRRLPAESVRDAMLAASGSLNGAMYGPSFRPFEIVKNPGSYHSYEPVDSADPNLQRRTIYRMNVNSGGNPLLDALDCPLPSMKAPKRSATTTALQALSLMNNPFVQRMADALANRLQAERPDTGTRVDRAFQLVLGRQPRPEELAASVQLAGQSGLAALCWGLFNSSEFLYVR
jgi:hypothetical protein